MKISIPQRKKQAYELVYWHNAPVRRRMAWIPVDECRRYLPKESRYAHDNESKKVLALMVGTGVGAGIGLLGGLLLAFVQSGVFLDSQDLVLIATLTTVVGLLGYMVGRMFIYPFMLVAPRYMIRAQKIPLPAGAAEDSVEASDAEHVWGTSALILDTTEDEHWRHYLVDLREQLRKRLDERGEKPERADTLIPNPVISGTPIARYDAYTMHNIEEMRDEQKFEQGWDPTKTNRGAIMKLGFVMFVAIAGVAVIGILLNDARSKAAVEGAAKAGAALLGWWG